MVRANVPFFMHGKLQAVLQAVPLPISDRVRALQNGTVDFVVAGKVEDPRRLPCARPWLCADAFFC